MDIALIGLIATFVAFRIIGMTTGREAVKPLNRRKFLIHLGILGLLLSYCVGSGVLSFTSRASQNREQRLVETKSQSEMLLQEGRTAEATGKASEALAQARDRYGAEDPRTLPYLHLRMKCLGREKKVAEAEASAQLALDIASKSFEKDGPEVALEENNLGALYAEMGKLERAETFYRSALAKVERVTGQIPAVLPVVLENLAGLCEQTGRADEARQLRDRVPGTRGRRAGEK